MASTVRIFEVASDEDIDRCFPVMVQLRPDLERREFVTRVRRMAREGYRLAALEDRGLVCAVAGFRVCDMLHRGRNLYVDDLVTDESHRSSGHGASLLRWLRDLARAEGCARLDLDSGVQRTGAHRFYFREGMHIASYHFILDVRAS